MHEQIALLDQLPRIKSEELDETVFGVFRAATALGVAGTDRVYVDEVAMLAAKRLVGTDRDEEFRRYFERRISEIERTPQASPERYRLEGLRSCDPVPTRGVPAPPRSRTP